MSDFIYIISTNFNLTFAYFILNGFQLNPDYYNCDPNYTPQEHKRQSLYSTCLLAIAKSDQMKMPAYKVMMFLGVCDMTSTFFHSLVTGFLGFYAISFCDYPRIIFTCGALGMSSWMACCISSLTLAIIRICDLNSQSKLRRCFDGWRIYIVLFIFLLYCLYPMLLTNPILFNPAYMSWFFDPGVGKDARAFSCPSLYVNVFHTFNNTMTAVGTIAFYAYMAVVFMKESKSSSNRKLTKMQISILLQSFLFCIFHAISAAIYSYMQFFESSETVVLIGHIAWQASSGSVCIVYLTLNKTIRNSVLKMFCST